MLFLLFLGFTSPVAHAACGDAAAEVAAAEAAVISLRVDEAAAALERAEAAFACGPLADTRVLGRLWLAEGTRLNLVEDREGSRDAYAAAARVAPGLWVDAYGPIARQQYLAAAPSTAEGRLLLRDAVPGYRSAVDGQELPFPASVPTGLHLVQILGRDGLSRYAQIFYLSDDVPVEISAPLERAPDVEASPAVLALRRRAVRDWAEMESSTQDTSPRAERRLKRYVARYGDLWGQAGDQRIYLDIPQVAEAQARLDTLPARRAQEAADRASKEKFDKEVAAARPPGWVEPPRVRPTGSVALAYTGAGEPYDGNPDQSGAFSGVGMHGAAGVAIGLAGRLGIAAKLGYQDLFGQPPEVPGDVAIAPTMTALHAGTASLALTVQLDRLRLGLGPALAIGVSYNQGKAGSGAADGSSLAPYLSYRSAFRAGGLQASADWTPAQLGRLALGPSLEGGALTDSGRWYTWVGLGVGLTLGAENSR